MIRQPIITVLGHVDHGKTLFLDRVRGTAIAEKEAGGITQHIGATEVPVGVIQKTAGALLVKYKFGLEIPGLLFIDTPGHEAFTSLRTRGGSIADQAVLVIDIMQGLQPQTIEAIEILKNFKVPFLVAANKIDKLYGYDSRDGSFSDNTINQSEKAMRILDEKLYEFVGRLHEHGFSSERFDRCNDFTKQVPIVPISAKTGEGLPEVLMLLAGLSQRFLKNELTIDEREAGKGTILEVKEEKGLGTTIDVILYEGQLKVNDKIALGTGVGVVETKVRALLKPKPLQEILQSSEKFQTVQSVHAACGVKIAAPGLDGALAGSPVMAVKKGDEAAQIRDELKSVQIETQALGPVLRADTLGSLEALVVLLEKEGGLKAKRASVGAVNRKDVLEALAVASETKTAGVIFAYNVKIDESAADEIKKSGLPVFSGNVVYKLIEDYQAFVRETREKQRQAQLQQIVWPAHVQCLPQHIYRNSKPAVVGVRVLAGKVRPGIEVMKANGERLGKVTAVQSQNENVDEAGVGEEVAMSIDGAVVGRNLEGREQLYSFITAARATDLLNLEGFFSESERDLLEKIKSITIKEEDTT